MTTPLAERMRPETFDDYVAQTKIVGKGTPLRRVIESGYLPSMIFWGPPGSGKTTLAYILAKETKRPFYSISAINAGVKDVREVIARASEGDDLFSGGGQPILFIDEIHRFSKSQQDSLLSAVERGQITLVGATTENPSFEVIPALLSRCQVYVLESHTKDDLIAILRRAAEKDEYLKSRKVTFREYDALIRISGGDARKLLNTLELVVSSEKGGKVTVTNELVAQKVQQNPARYDKTGEQHYDIISAFIKSIRGSDPNAAVYWLARMIAGGEDLKFIARRLVILASEDIGNANPTALILANNTFQAVSVVGYPESRIILSQCVTYLASSPKSNASYMAINNALSEVERSGDLSVPLHLRNAPTKLMKELNYGADYVYPHDMPGNFSPQEYMPDALRGKKFYSPGENDRESALARYLRGKWGDKYGY
ncbi:MAG: replication-associated recombination protein A [Flavobacteriales bacterium]|nr:replication-associated recombination protein A [Flavobacteriales bacterium]PWM12320.1 MAG: AAA family ATPase [Flavobacteriales bacterium]